jgi:hypothetical protein
MPRVNVVNRTNERNLTTSSMRSCSQRLFACRCCCWRSPNHCPQRKANQRRREREAEACAFSSGWTRPIFAHTPTATSRFWAFRFHSLGCLSSTSPVELEETCATFTQSKSGGKALGILNRRNRGYYMFHSSRRKELSHRSRLERPEARCTSIVFVVPRFPLG